VKMHLGVYVQRLSPVMFLACVMFQCDEFVLYVNILKALSCLESLHGIGVSHFTDNINET
jgi:hypothetical protein